jgi:hypothetical protein
MTLGACVVAVLLATASVTAGAAWAATGGLPGTGDTSFNPAGNSEDNHCISPEGVDANELLGISEQLVLPGVCDVVQAGEFYVFFNATWLLNTFSEAVPADYTPSAPTPLENFTSKVRSMTYVVDPGTTREQSYRFAPQDIMDVRTAHDFFPETGPDWPVALFLAKLPPLPPGDHRLVAVIDMSARHCDGLGTDPAAHCLGAGITKLTVCPFKVIATPASKPRGQRRLSSAPAESCRAMKYARGSASADPPVVPGHAPAASDFASPGQRSGGVRHVWALFPRDTVQVDRRASVPRVPRQSAPRARTARTGFAPAMIGS